MAATKVQRIGIWVIAAFMAIGTIGSFAIIVLANDNAQKDKERLATLTSEYQAKVSAQSTELSEKYFDTLNKEKSRVGAFDAASVTELAKTDIKVGDGAEITAESTFSAYYIGWNPKGVIFDSSLDDGKLKKPIEVVPGGVIQGWTDGVVGMKVGGVRELAIPSDLAYGETGQGADIPANTPIKFIVMIIPTPEPVVPSDELTKLYTRVNGSGN